MSKNSGTNNRGSGNTHTESGLSLDEIYNMGNQAAAALNSPIYQLAHKMAVDQTILEWANTAPKEKELRDSKWHEVQALGRASDLLRGMVARAQQIADQQQKTPEQEHNDYLDLQGFGIQMPDVH